jgi:tRNA modification GTPase
LIDHGIVIFFPGPRSFTGEDCLELQVHGSRAVVALLLRCLAELPGCRLAEAGEFIRRAFEIGKLPLTSVEGLADLLDARTELQRQQSLAQAGGRLAARASIWREKLLEARALIEAEIDFADEGEAPSDVLPHVRGICAELIRELDHALLDATRGERIRSGFHVVIAGPPNAGKSSLMNALARRTVSIVTHHAGTTRDVIQVELDLEGFPVVLSDTAGLRETADPVESIGVELSRKALSGASLVLMLTEAQAEVPAAEIGGAKVVKVASKCDLAPAPQWADVALSTVTGAGLDDLVSYITKEASTQLSGEPALVTNERQRQLVTLAAADLKRAVAQFDLPSELLAEELRRATRNLESMTGLLDSDAVLGEVFSRFCMGK